MRIIYSNKLLSNRSLMICCLCNDFNWNLYLLVLDQFVFILAKSPMKILPNDLCILFSYPKPCLSTMSIYYIFCLLCVICFHHLTCLASTVRKLTVSFCVGAVEHIYDLLRCIVFLQDLINVCLCLFAGCFFNCYH